MAIDLALVSLAGANGRHFPAKILNTELTLANTSRISLHFRYMQLECSGISGQSVSAYKHNKEGVALMESSKTGSVPASFMQQMLQNKFLFLAVALAVSAAAYFGVGLYLLIGR